MRNRYDNELIAQLMEAYEMTKPRIYHHLKAASNEGIPIQTYLARLKGKRNLPEVEEEPEPEVPELYIDGAIVPKPWTRNYENFKRSEAGKWIRIRGKNEAR